MNGQEILALMQGHKSYVPGGTYYNGATYKARIETYESLYVWIEHASRNPIYVPGLGLVKVVEDDSGGEGHAEDIHIVFSIEFETDIQAGTERLTYWRMDGYYASYGDGDVWDEDSFHEVTPQQRLITFYE